MKVRWTDGARQDLLDIIRIVSLDDPTAAEQSAARIRDSVRQTADYPRIGKMVPEFGDESVRERIIPPYRVFYRIGESIEILGIYHGRRALPDLDDVGG